MKSTVTELKNQLHLHMSRFQGPILTRPLHFTSTSVALALWAQGNTAPMGIPCKTTYVFKSKAVTRCGCRSTTLNPCCNPWAKEYSQVLVAHRVPQIFMHCSITLFGQLLGFASNTTAAVSPTSVIHGPLLGPLWTTRLCPPCVSHQLKCGPTRWWPYMWAQVGPTEWGLHL